MDRRPLGKTNLCVTPLGFGAFKIGRNEGIKYPLSYELPDEREVEQLLNGVLDAGISYIDTAPAYGSSEERIGRAISHRRKEYALSTKVGETFADGRSSYDFSAAAVRLSVTQSLRSLRTDVLDIVLVHANDDDVAIQENTDVVTTLQALRDQGLVRAIGLSAKTVAGARRSLAWADVLMVEYHLNNRSHEDVMREAAGKKVAVVAKKGLASGWLDPKAAIEYILSNPAVSSLAIGTLSLSHIQQDIAVLRRQSGAPGCPLGSRATARPPQAPCRSPQ